MAAAAAAAQEEETGAGAAEGCCSAAAAARSGRTLCGCPCGLEALVIAPPNSCRIIVTCLCALCVVRLAAWPMSRRTVVVHTTSHRARALFQTRARESQGSKPCLPNLGRPNGMRGRQGGLRLRSVRSKVPLVPARRPSPRRGPPPPPKRTFPPQGPPLVPCPPEQCAVSSMQPSARQAPVSPRSGAPHGHTHTCGRMCVCLDGATGACGAWEALRLQRLSPCIQGIAMPHLRVAARAAAWAAGGGGGWLRPSR